MSYHIGSVRVRRHFPNAPPEEMPEGWSEYRRSENEDVEHYVYLLNRILLATPTYGVPPDPSQIYPNVFLGTAANAENLSLLRRLGICYILNCAGIAAIRPQRDARYGKDSGVLEYEELPAEDGTTYDMLHHFVKAHGFIDHARNRGGNVLIYCPDVNRSGCIGIGYLMRKGASLMNATKMIKEHRKTALFNKGFMKQLVLWARDHGQLERDLPHLGLGNMGLVRVRDRPMHSHLLSI